MIKVFKIICGILVIAICLCGVFVVFNRNDSAVVELIAISEADKIIPNNPNGNNYEFQNKHVEKHDYETVLRYFAEKISKDPELTFIQLSNLQHYNLTEIPSYTCFGYGVAKILIAQNVQSLTATARLFFNLSWSYVNILIFSLLGIFLLNILSIFIGKLRYKAIVRINEVNEKSRVYVLTAIGLPIIIVIIILFFSFFDIYWAHNDTIKEINKSANNQEKSDDFSWLNFILVSLMYLFGDRIFYLIKIPFIILVNSISWVGIFFINKVSAWGIQLLYLPYSLLSFFFAYAIAGLKLSIAWLNWKNPFNLLGAITISYLVFASLTGYRLATRGRCGICRTCKRRG